MHQLDPTPNYFFGILKRVHVQHFLLPDPECTFYVTWKCIKPRVDFQQIGHLQETDTFDLMNTLSWRTAEPAWVWSAQALVSHVIYSLWFRTSNSNFILDRKIFPARRATVSVCAMSGWAVSARHLRIHILRSKESGGGVWGGGCKGLTCTWTPASLAGVSVRSATLWFFSLAFVLLKSP